MPLLSHITWDVSPELFSLGPVTVRWYGLLFAAAFVVGYRIMYWVFKREGKPIADLEQLAIYMIVGTVIGARLGHCLFYSPEYYLSNPIEILMVWKGGLASHGATVGILIALYYYSKKKKENLLWLLDRVVMVTAIGGALIRLGNLFNSEIVGKATDVSWAFIFTSYDSIPRHPTQLYESIAYILIFIFLFFLYKKRWKLESHGFLFGLFLILLFTFRFFVEFLKENQSGFEEGMTLNMGQLLSIPFVIIGVVFLIRSRNTQSSSQLNKNKKKTSN